MSDLIEKPGGGRFWISFLAVVGCFLIFAVVLYVAYLPSRPTTVGPAANLTPEERLERNLLTPDQRKERLAEMHAKEKDAATTYGWVDQANGVVRLPIARAMELTVRDLQKKQDGN